MDSLDPRLPHPSFIAGVAQVASSDQTMEHVSTVSHSTIAIDRPSSFRLTNPKENCVRSASEPCSSGPSQQLFTDASLPHGLRVRSEDSNSLPSHQYSPPSPPLRLSIGSKRVEDVKMNRIDKSRSGRRRRACHRPFVFKSSPLAEGNGAGRFTSFASNPFCPYSKYSKSALRHSTDGALSKSPQSALECARSPVHSSPFMGASTSSLNVANYELNDVSFTSPYELNDVSFTCPSISTTSVFPPFYTWSKQPQIPTRRTFKPMPPIPSNMEYLAAQRATAYHLSWEISLPQCSLPTFGTTLMS